MTVETAALPKWAMKLQSLGACGDAVAWACEQKSEQQGWDQCERGDWMVWLLGKLAGQPGSDARKRLVLAACDCAESALPHFEKRYPKDERVRRCIETCRSWAEGKATIKDLRKARAAAAYAAYAATAYAAAYAAYAADAAAAAADAAAAAAADAATAYAAAYGAAAAAYAARTNTLKACAEIVRRHYPESPIKDWKESNP